jgi:putative transposase
VIEVSGRKAGRVTIAGLVCYRPGQRSRLLYRLHVHHRRAGENASFTETDYIGLLDDAHQQLRAPIVLIWDSLNRHISAKMRGHLQTRDWLRVIRLPAYAPNSTRPRAPGQSSNAASPTWPSATSTTSPH